ncbi:uncharacterized protein LOC125763938 isoform X2 [Anopheles funestus]|uniref:uncharacterized protein LOC125763938 isoform X2 n=1 Tax=Anopheles funestus TaxID=62324 RepID=UPI0020C60DAD|nr:uncharacterized protein LOC125763938 isoform X2 [Anopheles funestus]
MIGIQALETNPPVERRPLQGKYCVNYVKCFSPIAHNLMAYLVLCADINVNRIHHPNIPSKDGANTGKASIPFGFQVFADGETSSFTKKANVKIFPCKKDSVAKDIGANVNSVSDRTVPKAGTQVASMNWVEKQLAAMQVEKQLNKEMVPIAEKHAVEDIKYAVPTAHPYYESSVVLDNSAKQYEANICASSENFCQEKGPKSNGTGAIRKVTSNAACSTELKSAVELPTFKLNVTAEEWSARPNNTTTGTHFDNGTSCDFTQSNSMPTFWNLHAEDFQPKLSVPYPEASGTYGNNFVTNTHHRPGRKIVGRNLGPVEKVQQCPMLCDSLKQLDDRSDEIARYHKHKEALRNKATEAMRIQQARLNRTSEQYPTVPTNGKNMLPQTTTTYKNYPSEWSGMSGLQRGRNTSYNQVPTVPFAAELPSVKRSVCIIKYPTPPNVPIRYEPTELMKMNHTPYKNQNKQQRNEFPIKNQKQERTTNNHEKSKK